MSISGNREGRKQQSGGEMELLVATMVVAAVVLYLYREERKREERWELLSAASSAASLPGLPDIPPIHTHQLHHARLAPPTTTAPVCPAKPQPADEVKETVAAVPDGTDNDPKLGTKVTWKETVGEKEAVGETVKLTEAERRKAEREAHREEHRKHREATLPTRRTWDGRHRRHHRHSKRRKHLATQDIANANAPHIPNPFLPNNTTTA